jgi:hypothetical protein
MENEFTLGDIYEDIAERLAIARTKALMGERQEALNAFQQVSLDYHRFRDVLEGYPGFRALEHAFQATMTALCAEEEQSLRSARASETTALFRLTKPRRKARQAA